MLFSIISPKGGTGCTTVSSLFGLSASQHNPTLIIDGCNGDMHGILNPESPPKFNFLQWCVSPNPDIASLQKISHQLKDDLYFVSNEFDRSKETNEKTLEILQSTSSFTYEKRHSIVEALSRFEGDCVIDLGRRQDLLAQTIIEASDVVVMVLRQCYLSLNSAIRHPFATKIDSIVVVKEQGRSITSDEITKTLSNDVLIELKARRDWAKAIDAGVLAFRTPASMIEPIDHYIADLKKNKNLKADSSRHEPNIDETFWSRNEDEFSSSNPFLGARRIFNNAKA